MFRVTNHSRYLASHLDPELPGQDPQILRRRPLGTSGLVVGEIGLGTAALGRESLPDHEAEYAIATALDQQVSLLDTAPTYGRALLRMGRALKGRRRQAQICLKAGYESDGRRDYGPQALTASLESSLKLLGTDNADILLLHNPGADVLNASHPAWEALGKLKAAGKIRAFGVSLSFPEEAKVALDKTPAQVLELPYNVFFQENAVVFAPAAAKGVGLLVNRPLDSGWLAGRYGAHHIFFDERRRWSRADKARRAQLQAAFEAVLAGSGLLPVQAALQFALARPEVGCAVVGASAWQQVVGNVSAGQRRLDPSVLVRLTELWEKQIKSAPLGL
jgi:aryl-alcohol dehydrogenase-like predicted oxidoreductase